jgi:hypothetical protein
MGFTPPNPNTKVKATTFQISPSNPQKYQETLTGLISGELEDGWHLKMICPINCDGWTCYYQLVFEKTEYV